jgi:hypothetical protein
MHQIGARAPIVLKTRFLRADARDGRDGRVAFTSRHGSVTTGNTNDHQDKDAFKKVILKKAIHLYLHQPFLLNLDFAKS